MKYSVLLILIFIWGCKNNDKIPKPLPNTEGLVTNHTSIISLAKLNYKQKDTLNVFLASQYSKDKPFIKPLIYDWFKGTVIENIDSNKVIILKCYTVNKELYKIANKDFNWSPIQRDSVLKKIKERCFLEMKYANENINLIIYDSAFIGHL